MTKTLTNAILITSTAFVAFMIVTPLSHLSAQNQVTLDVTKKVHKANIQSLQADQQGLVIAVDSLSISVVTDASTTFSSSNGDQVDFSALRTGGVVYVFGYYDPVAKSIYAEKIVICNKSKTGRTSLSKVELEQQSSSHSFALAPADDFGLTVSNK